MAEKPPTPDDWMMPNFPAATPKRSLALDPSSMQFYAAPLPFHPEELYKHVKDLERIFATIPDHNGRVTLAKAIIAATGSFVEGCLDDLIRMTLGRVGVPAPIQKWILDNKSSGIARSGMARKSEFLKDLLAGLRSGWKVSKRASDFIEGVRQLRNKVDHGNAVDEVDLRFGSIHDFRTMACDYLEQVYASVDEPKPGWLGT
jgi:hypothetical protein